MPGVGIISYITVLLIRYNLLPYIFYGMHTILICLKQMKSAFLINFTAYSKGD